MLICHPFLLFWHCLLSLSDMIASTHTQHFYRHLIILVIGLRCSTQAPCFTAPFMPLMTLLGFMCPGPGKLIRSWALSHCAINRPHDTSLFSHSPSPDQLLLLCTSFSFATRHVIYGTCATMSAPTIAFVLISPVHTDKKGTNRIHPTLHISLYALTSCLCSYFASRLHSHFAPYSHFSLCLHLAPCSHLHLHLASLFTLLPVHTSSSFIRLYTA